MQCIYCGRQMVVEEPVEYNGNRCIRYHCCACKTELICDKQRSRAYLHDFRGQPIGSWRLPAHLG